MRVSMIYHPPSGVVLMLQTSSVPMESPDQVFSGATHVHHEGVEYAVADLRVLVQPLDRAEEIASPTQLEAQVRKIHAAQREGAFRVKTVRGKPRLRGASREELENSRGFREQAAAAERLKSVQRELLEIREAVQGGAPAAVYQEERKRLLAERDALNQRLSQSGQGGPRR